MRTLSFFLASVALAACQVVDTPSNHPGLRGPPDAPGFFSDPVSGDSQESVEFLSALARWRHDSGPRAVENYVARYPDRASRALKLVQPESQMASELRVAYDTGPGPKWESAQRAVEEAEKLTKDGRRAAVALEAADLAIRAGDPRLAERALQLNGDRELDRRRALASLYLSRGEYDDCLRAIAALPNPSPDELARFQLIEARARMALGNSAEAMSTARNAAKSNELSIAAAAHAFLGAALAGSGDRAAARSEFESALATDAWGGAARARSDYGLLLNEEGELERARLETDRARLELEKQGDFVGLARSLRAEAGLQVERGEVDAAKQLEELARKWIVEHGLLVR